jgi:hypothetical protein
VNAAALLVACALLLWALAHWHFAEVDPLLFAFCIVVALAYIGGPRLRKLPFIAFMAAWTAATAIVLAILGTPWWISSFAPLTIFLLLLRGEWEKMVHGGRAAKTTRRNDGESRASVSLASGQPAAISQSTGRWQTLLRVLKHSLIAPWRARSVYSESLLAVIGDRIAESECRHRGEIVVALETRWSTDDIRRDQSPAQHARNRFSELGVWNTEFNNGVLIHVTLAERAIDVIADRGIAERVEASAWQIIADDLAAACARGAFQSGLLAAIDRVGSLLGEHFPVSASEENPDELVNAPVLT